MLASVVLSVALVGCVAASDVTLESFTKPIHDWVENNDPVMGGRSTGTTSMSNSMLVFNGSVVDVPALKAPGFITTQTTDKTAWADVSGCQSLSMTLRSSTNYDGYRVSFGRARAIVCKKFFAYGYKAPFTAPMGEFATVTIPFGNFSDCWDDATGGIITPCSENDKFCPTQSALQNLETVSIWGEGVGGDVHLEVKEIFASGCK